VAITSSGPGHPDTLPVSTCDKPETSLFISKVCHVYLYPYIYIPKTYSLTMVSLVLCYYIYIPGQMNMSVRLGHLIMVDLTHLFLQQLGEAT
jgi:hypothetical protein